MSIHKKRTKLTTIFKWVAGLFFASVIVLCLLGSYIDSFRFSIIYGSNRIYSETKEEAIRRKTYVCDVHLPSQPYKVSNNHYFSIKNGWIEKSWHGGFWSTTTNLDTGDDAYYHIVIITKRSINDTVKWVIMNKPKHGHWDDIRFEYPENLMEGNVFFLPFSDTLHYSVLKKDTADFRPENVDGTLAFVLQRH